MGEWSSDRVPRHYIGQGLGVECLGIPRGVEWSRVKLSYRSVPKLVRCPLIHSLWFT